MNDEERQRTMDFILQQQAQFSAGMQKLEEQQTQFAAGLQGTNNRLESLERVVVLMARQFRRERKDLRERIAALVDAQIKTEENLSRSDERLTRLEDITRQNSENIRAHAAATERDRENIAALADMIDKLARGRNGDGDGS
jgi:predicted  nucleic acid-binding Zn-ribbon protein